MVSTRTLYRAKRLELIEKIVLGVLRLARVKGQDLDSIPLPTLKLILMLVENPHSAIGAERLKKISRMERKGSLSYFGKRLGQKPQNEETGA